MKKQYAALLSFLLFVSGFLFSCHDKGKDRKGALEFDSIGINRTVHLFNDTVNPACNLIVNFTYPVKSSDKSLRDSLTNYFVSECFGDRYAGIRPDSAITVYAENYIRQYKYDLEPMYLEDKKNNEDESAIGNWYSYYKCIESRVQYYEKNLLVYRIDYNEYTGGAHGMYSTTFLNMDLTLMRPLHLEDLFIADYQEALTDLIWNQLMADNNVASHEELEELGYGSTGEITPTENFYLDDHSITFYYNVYDIAPYVMGPVKVSIPLSMVEALLNNDFANA